LPPKTNRADIFLVGPPSVGGSRDVLQEAKFARRVNSYYYHDRPLGLHGYHRAGTKPPLHQRDPPPVWTRKQASNCVTFKEAGLGSTPVTYTFAASTGTTFTYQCFTSSGNNPQGSPNSVSGSTDKTVTTITPHNGTISATICLIPEQDGADCNGQGLVLKLIAVDYDGVTFSDGVGNTVNIPDACSGSGCP